MVNMKQQAELNFFCELDGQALASLFENRFVFDDLKSLKAGLSLGILDFSPQRAEVVRKLNKMGIPLTAWLLLPKEQGYWFNLENYPAAIKFYEDFKVWSASESLQWQCIGLDIEPDINQLSHSKDQKPSLFKNALARLWRPKKLKEATLAYQGLVNTIHLDGWKVESYHFPFILDDRKAHATVIQRLAGLVDLSADREVLMLYSSLYQPFGEDVLNAYAQEADAIGIGTTGGGVVLDRAKSPRHLSWPEFARDLRLAYRHKKAIYIFSLEGCVWQKYLPRLTTFNWQEEPVKEKFTLLKALRLPLQALLYLIQRPFIILSAVLGLASGLIIHRRIKGGAKRAADKVSSKRPTPSD